MRDLISRSNYTRFSGNNNVKLGECLPVLSTGNKLRREKIKNKPGPGGISKLPRNFLIVGTSEHQLLKSAKDIPFSEPSSDFEKVAALSNASTISL